jgi:hypothetical protein
MVIGYSNTVNGIQQTTSIVNLYPGRNWVVQYITASSTTGLSGWPWQDWTIVRPNPLGFFTAVEDPWRPAAPVVICPHDHEQIIARLERMAREQEERQQVEEERRQAAAARARQLLLGELDAVQRAQFEAERYFIHIGRRGRRYRIRPAVSANIDVLSRRGGRVLERLCVHPQGAHRMPVEDTMLAQLLHLRDDEARLLQIANRHPALAA